MVTIDRRHGFSVVIFTQDHSPPHVHVFGDGQVKIDLAGPDVVFSIGMKRSDVRRAWRLVAERRDEYLRRWSEIYG